MIHTLTKTVAVVVSSTILATLTVNALDVRGNAITTYLAALLFRGSAEVQLCPEHMTLIQHDDKHFCIDTFEASPGKGCVFASPNTKEESAINLARPSCGSVSEPERLPWRYITQEQAHTACLQSGKRLPTPGEWLLAARGTPDARANLDKNDCNIANNRTAGVDVSGSGTHCVSEAGVYDMVGNVWEWVEGTYENGARGEEQAPQSGFVRAVNSEGLATETKSGADDSFGNDRFWMDATITTGLMRGGAYTNEGGAGIYAVYAASPPSFTGDGVGFRCVAEPNVTP